MDEDIARRIDGLSPVARELFLEVERWGEQTQFMVSPEEVLTGELLERLKALPLEDRREIVALWGAWAQKAREEGARLQAEGRVGGKRTVPAWYPDFTDADKVRRWDGSEQAEAWAKLKDFRDECIAASVGELAGTGIENIDYAGLIAFLWDIDEDEAAEIVRRRQQGL